MRPNQGELFGGDWTEKKLQILQDYLKTYTKALKNQPFQKYYVDAFAGTGYREKRRKESKIDSLFKEIEEDTSQRFLKGSAKRALEVTPPFDGYIFVENDPDNVSKLEKLKGEYRDKADHISIFQDDANLFLQDYCRLGDWKSARAVVFLDPFATEVEWGTIEAIASTEAIDLWILFPVMAVNRLLAKNPDKAFHKKLDMIFGTEDWFPKFYKNKEEVDLLNGTYTKTVKACAFSDIRNFYLERLNSVFCGVAQNPRILENSKGSPIFYLFFAASNKRGTPIALNIAEHLLRSL